MNLNAEGTEDLDSQLSNIDISVPPREEDRTTEDCERWSIARFLATLNRTGELIFPIVVSKRERPDFSIELDNESWGVEITEAIPTSYARALVIAAKENPEAVIDMSLFKYGEEKSLEEIREIVNASTLTGPGWAGNGAEQELAEAVNQVVSKKTEKLRNHEFSKFPINILLIYENMPLSSLNLETAKEFISEALSSYWDEAETFDRVFIESDNTMLDFNAQSQQIVGIPELWQKE
ncbi:hypothetical protein [Sedimenticola hydrogenitrophicus]|uniref:hypothetical protein n=1 Tax=Sedimenticola hydrogenitrophicus TaxID=2967975 RepID=UPI0021A4EF3C|nr:hypothetical protein [Sedimenticola hydrogenitrophicus]